jgi:hypothetical protein
MAESCLVAGLGGDMEKRDPRRAGVARRSEPSWPTVIATTVRLWLERHHVRRPAASARRLLLLAGVLAVAVAAAAAGAFIGRGTTSPAAPAVSSINAASIRAATAVRDQAAAWVARQVAPSAIVACDPAMCAALQVSGVPADRVLMLGTTAADPLGSDVVVATPALRTQFGARLETVYAPAVIASFGSGTARIDIRAMAPDGAAAYEAALATDRGARISAGRQLLRNRRIQAGAGVRAALRAGEVDARLLAMFAALAAEQPLRILALADPSPGVMSLAAPYRGAEIAPGHAGTKTAARVREMLSFLRAQRLPYLPTRAALAGRSALNIEYSAPSPLGLLNGP